MAAECDVCCQGDATMTVTFSTDSIADCETPVCRDCAIAIFDTMLDRQRRARAEVNAAMAALCGVLGISWPTGWPMGADVPDQFEAAIGCGGRDDVAAMNDADYARWKAGEHLEERAGTVGGGLGATRTDPQARSPADTRPGETA